MDIDQEDCALLEHWVIECSHSYEIARTDRLAPLHFLSLWVAGHARSLLAEGQLFEDHLASDLSDAQISFLAWICSWARRHLDRLQVDEEEVWRISELIWERMDDASPHVITIPRRLAEQVLLDHLAGINYMLAMGLTPPGPTDGWENRFEPRIRQAIQQDVYGLPDRIIIIECVVDDVARLAGAALGVALTASNPAVRDAARSAAWYVAQSLPFDMADHILQRMSWQSRSTTAPPGVIFAHPPSYGQLPATGAAPAPHPNLLCSYCNLKFSSQIPICPRCDVMPQLGSVAGENSEMTSYHENSSNQHPKLHLPNTIPWSAVIAGGVVALIVSFITTWISWEGNFWLIIAFPAAIGASGGFVTACFAISKSRIFRLHYWIYPIIIGLAAYLATFWIQYEFAISDLEEAGFVNVREQLPFSEFVQIMASQQFAISRVGRSSDIETEGDPSDAYTLWSIEATVAAGAGYWGWRRGIRYKYGFK